MQSNPFISLRGCAALLGFSAVGAVALAAPALADPAPPPPPAEFSWTGLHVGAFVGKTTNNGDYYGPANEFGPNSTERLHSDDVTYGGEIGYDRQIGKWFVLGVAAGLHGTSQTAGNTYTGGEGYGGLTSLSRHHTFGGDVSARVGVAVGHALAYGKIGYSFDKFDYTAVTALQTGNSPRGGLGNAGQTYGASKTRSGLLVGGGLEFAILRHVSLFGEYDHVTYTASNQGFSGGDGSTFQLPIGEQVETVKIGVRYRF